MTGLPRVLFATCVANLPMLALLLVPQLMRSRAGSESWLLVGSTLYLALIALGLVIAPGVSAWAAPKAGIWTVRTARMTAREIRRTRTAEFWQRVGEWFFIFVLAQAAGGAIAWLMPYVSDNPSFGAPGEPRWNIHYGNYVLHVVVIYLFSCLSFAWLGVRLRELAVPRA